MDVDVRLVATTPELDLAIPFSETRAWLAGRAVQPATAISAPGVRPGTLQYALAPPQGRPFLVTLSPNVMTPDKSWLRVETESRDQRDMATPTGLSVAVTRAAEAIAQHVRSSLGQGVA
jgi:hypothetical protein